MSSAAPAIQRDARAPLVSEDLIKTLRDVNAEFELCEEGAKADLEEVKDIIGNEPFSAVRYELPSAHDKFRREAIEKLFDYVIRKHLPNTGLRYDTTLGEAERSPYRLDVRAFDIERALEYLNDLVSQGDEISRTHILREIHGLKPWDSGSRDQPIKIEKATLTLHSRTKDAYTGEASNYQTSGGVENFEYLEKAILIGLADADPRTVESHIWKDIEPNLKEFYNRAWSCRFFSLRFYKNDNVKATFITEDLAKAVKAALEGESFPTGRLPPTLGGV